MGQRLDGMLNRAVLLSVAAAVVYILFRLIELEERVRRNKKRLNELTLLVARGRAVPTAPALDTAAGGCCERRPQLPAAALPRDAATGEDDGRLDEGCADEEPSGAHIVVPMVPRSVSEDALLEWESHRLQAERLEAERLEDDGEGGAARFVEVHCSSGEEEAPPDFE